MDQDGFDPYLARKAAPVGPLAGGGRASGPPSLLAGRFYWCINCVVGMCHWISLTMFAVVLNDTKCDRSLGLRTRYYFHA